VRLEELSAFVRARTVALFWPMQDRHEIDLRAFGTRLRARGVRVALPRVESVEAAMTFRLVDDTDAMVEDPSGLLEPRPEDPVVQPGELDVIVVPALALDPRGHRIGYGRGYYDRTLPAFAPPATTVGVAFDFQLVAEVPNEPGDVAVGWVVTDARSLAAQ
jgi:5-formyltetrahydrofolate cyclo-ligase